MLNAVTSSILTQNQGIKNLSKNDVVFSKLLKEECDVGNNICKDTNRPEANFIIKYTLRNVGKAYGEIYDAEGKLVNIMSEQSCTGKNIMEFDLSTLHNGIYHYRFKTSEGKCKSGNILMCLQKTPQKIITHKLYSSTVRKGFGKGKKIVLVAGIVLSSLLPMKNVNAGELYVANPFVQPNDTSLNWYGSGDANGDNTLDWNDVIRMQEVINRSYIPDTSQDRRVYDRMDITGDEIINNEDKSKLEEHLRNEAFFQPNWYFNKLKTRQEKEDWLQKMLNIDKTSEAEKDGQIPGWDCDQYNLQTYLNFQGILPKHLEMFKKISKFEYTWEDNGRFNLPLLEMTTTDTLNGEHLGGHAMNTSILGNDITKWNSLCNIEPQWDQINVQPGQAYLMTENTEIRLRGPPSRGPPEIPVYIIFADYMGYKIKNNIVTFEGFNDMTKYFKLITKRDTINPEINTSLENQGVYEIGQNASISVNDEYFKKAWYSFDKGNTKNNISEGVNNITLPNKEGNYPVYIYAGDDFYNEVLDSMNISIVKPAPHIDSIPPEIKINTPLNGETYYNSPVFNFNVSDETALDSSYYVLDGKKNIFNREFNENLGLDYGNYVLSVVGVDTSGNKTQKNVNFSINDLNSPEVNILSPLKGRVYQESPLFKFDVSDMSINPDSIYYQINGGKKIIFNGEFNENLGLDYGNYVLSVVGVDKGGNKTQKNINFSIADTVKPKINLEYIVNKNNVSVNWDVDEKNFNSDKSYIEFYGERENNIPQSGIKEFNDLEKGDYSLKLYSEDNFGNKDSVVHKININSIGLEKVLENDFKAYPNPVKDKFIIEYNLENFNKVYGEIYDSSGRLVDDLSEESYAGDNKMEFDVSGLSQGVYYYIIYSSYGIENTGLLVK